MGLGSVGLALLYTVHVSTGPSSHWSTTSGVDLSAWLYILDPSPPGLAVKGLYLMGIAQLGLALLSPVLLGRRQRLYIFDM
jgi:hypothetical protein